MMMMMIGHLPSAMSIFGMAPHICSAL